MRSFLWTGGTGKRKYHLVKWKLICKPRSKRGLGVKNLSLFNISLMCKWWWKLETGDGPWQSFMKKKYLSDATVFGVSQKRKDSAFWTDMLAVKDIYLCGRKMVVTNAYNALHCFKIELIFNNFKIVVLFSFFYYILSYRYINNSVSF